MRYEFSKFEDGTFAGSKTIEADSPKEATSQLAEQVGGAARQTSVLVGADGRVMYRLVRVLQED